MKLLADENMRRDIVDWLRATGHDVAWISESNPGVSDETILDMANRDERMVLSADLDFGELVIHRGATGQRASDRTNRFAAAGRSPEILSTTLAAN
jgi:predicted nuclease of predicted toxin-antitoxin system